MVTTTFKTSPFANIKRHFIDNMPAGTTSLRTGEPSVNSDEIPSVPTTLVVQLSNQLTPPAIGNSQGELVIFDHILNSQRLNSNCLIFAYQLSRGFVQEIFSRIGDFQVNFSYLNSRFPSIFRTFLFTSQILLSFIQAFAMLLEMLGISYLVTVTGSNQARYSQIYSYGILANGQRLNRWIIESDRDMPTSRWVKANRYTGWLTSVRELPRPSNRQWLRAFGKVNFFILELKSRLSKLSTAAIPFLFEVGIVRPSCKEVGSDLDVVVDCIDFSV